MRSSFKAAIIAAAVVLAPALTLATEVTPGGGRGGIRANASPTTWYGFAVSNNSRVFQSESFDGSGAEGRARQSAVGECERTTQRSCIGIAVTEEASVSVIECRRGSR